MKILIHYPFEPEQIKHFQELASQYGSQVVHASSKDEAVALASDVEVLMGHYGPTVCAAAPNLRWIQSFSTGQFKLLFPEIVERDEVAISNVAGLYASQGAEHAWALLLALARQIPLAIQNKEQKRWQSGQLIEIAGGTLGLIGLGGFGIEMAKRAQGYNMTILAVDPMRTEKPDYVAELKPTSRENLHALLKRSDVVMMACPRTEETYHLIGAEELVAMKATAYLINVTRGGIIDEAALIEALEQGQIAGAGLDVTEVEPLPDDDSLWNAPNLIITPHRAGASQHRPRMVFEFFLQNLERYLKGEKPLNVIDKRKAY